MGLEELLLWFNDRIELLEKLNKLHVGLTVLLVLLGGGLIYKHKLSCKGKGKWKRSGGTRIRK